MENNCYKGEGPGDTKDGYVFKYGISKAVSDIIIGKEHWFSPAYLDGAGTFDIKEEIKSRRHLQKIGAITFK